MNRRLTKLVDGANALLKGECDENLLERTSQELGYKHPEDYLSADKSSKFLGVSRNAFYDLVHKYNLENHRFNNVPIGYYIKDLEVIKINMR